MKKPNLLIFIFVLVALVGCANADQGLIVQTPIQAVDKLLSASEETKKINIELPLK